MLLDVVRCPYCGQKDHFFVNGGAIFKDGKRRRARLRLACMECGGEFVYVEENATNNIIPFIPPQNDLFYQTRNMSSAKV